MPGEGSPIDHLPRANGPHLRNQWMPLTRAVVHGHETPNESHTPERPQASPSELIADMIKTIKSKRYGPSVIVEGRNNEGHPFTLSIGTRTPKVERGNSGFDLSHFPPSKFLEHGLMVSERTPRTDALARLAATVGVKMVRRHDDFQTTTEGIQSLLERRGIHPHKIAGPLLYGLLSHGEPIPHALIGKALEMNIPGVQRVRLESEDRTLVRNGEHAVLVDMEGQIQKLAIQATTTERGTTLLGRGAENSIVVEADGRAQLLFGPIGRAAYPPYAQQKVEEHFGNPTNTKGREDRAKLWKNHDGLVQTIMNVGEGDVVQASYEYMKGLNDFARNQLEIKPEGGLGRHLEEITDFSRHFLIGADGNSRYPDLISTHHARLLADVAAPMHDLLKFLGSTDAQVMPDHEAITGEFVRKHFAGKKVMINEQPYILNQEDADFVAGIIADHENIEKPNEAHRSGYIHGTALERAKALFFIADVLTEAEHPEGLGQTFAFDMAQLDERFTDLYFRHIDYVHREGYEGREKTKGKIFRPEWGVHTITDLVETFHVLEKNGLVMDNPQGKSTQDILVGAALESIKRALDANDQRTDLKLTQDQLDAIFAARDELQALLSTNDASERRSIARQLSDSRELMRKYLSVQGIAHAEELAPMITKIVYGHTRIDAGRRVLSSHGIEMTENQLSELVDMLPLIEIGEMHHGEWREDFGKTHPGDTESWVNANPDKDRQYIAVAHLYAQNHNGELPPTMRMDGDNLVVNILGMTFAELPPSLQENSIESSRIAMREVRNIVIDKNGEGLIDYGNTVRAVIKDRSQFSLLNDPNMTDVHKIGNAIHTAWLERHGDTADELNKKSYDEIRAIANGNSEEAQRAQAIIMESLKFVDGAIKLTVNPLS